MPTPKNQEGYQYGWSLERPDDWMSKAACVGKWSLFTIKDQKLQTDSLGKWVGYDRKAIHEARMICMSCPVFYQCEKSATQEDFHWTVRAGRVPLAFNTKSRPEGSVRRPAGRPVQRRTTGDVCKKCEHPAIVVRTDGTSWCRECDRRRLERRRREKGIKPRELSPLCPKKHEPDWGIYEKTGSRFCRTCKRERAQNIKRDRRKVKP